MDTEYIRRCLFVDKRLALEMCDEIDRLNTVIKRKDSGYQQIIKVLKSKITMLEKRKWWRKAA